MEHFIKAAIKLPKSLHQATLRNSAFRGTETVPPSRDMVLFSWGWAPVNGSYKDYDKGFMGV